MTKVLHLDPNGLPIGHSTGADAAAEALADWINELPDSLYYLSKWDAEQVAHAMLSSYLISVRKEQRPTPAPLEIVK